MTEPLHPHGLPVPRAGSLWTVDGAWRRSPLGRRMTIVSDDARRLALHSSIRMNDEGLAALDALGEPSWLLVPNSFHGSEAGFYAQRHPRARVLVPGAIADGLRARLPRIDGLLEEVAPGELPLDVVPMAGTRMHEVAFVHAPSRTLVLTDLCFNLRGEKLPAIARLLMRANGAVDRFGPTRLLRLAFVSDRAALGASVAKLLERDFDRVIVSHGDVLESGGKQAMRAAFGARPR